ncbi:casein kinase II beta subunit [Saitoella complicata NRRL Y-17804]|uniref:casein kinase II beta subunit n=1 Tax=Saitoella complicata (strain BCRC 22490 / CBS 7301 / JCM 7358 / NBRC 10748 / NRRL Y-17804) TaxID=698492 RepID=UPI000866B682|nr:casein kinase II beta subunit [Saitoella complicata NRRL Y-17804]ODQ52967.1 casein kinase II beta subunit [Saitoella complicata NRRL Y-17804]
MDHDSSSSISSGYWIEWFLGSKGNEYFCEIDEDYITDRFNLTGLNAEIGPHYADALDMVTDCWEGDENIREDVESCARHFYGLVHARYIITIKGLQKMLEKYKKHDFGRCPRVLCSSHPLLPIGTSDLPGQDSVKLYCPRCEDIYTPKSPRHGSIDGAYFGTSFPHMLLAQYPQLVPSGKGRYVPRIFGFGVNEVGKLQRWQDGQSEAQRRRLAEPLEGRPGSRDVMSPMEQ